ncbi:4-galactosyl-N-acetylglucosaminide 3-alpha-L-fucosyltransferase 9 [Sinocyclocheilus anshuiensis]|uniref:4-galactosyl-N-acetylglucosaminide 3-alpha-L-fucosyltransferase 9 n=1 Tax=Sinocyclocheilus anshuiensis TaxID=1608454 RepID=UPI0007B9B09E|nr:PREDICTED: alpha-(1,3)-fucosyltransferase 9-like [Sinocyclocheilus anshuiensis]
MFADGQTFDFKTDILLVIKRRTRNIQSFYLLDISKSVRPEYAICTNLQNPTTPPAWYLFIRMLCDFVFNVHQTIYELVVRPGRVRNVHSPSEKPPFHQDQDYFPTIASCKFYLAFENSIHKDYITEKLYNPLSVGTVPVVLGPPRENYQNFMQGNAFIHVDDFPSPKELADYLLFLDKNEELYLKYFDWRKHFKVKKAYFWAEHTCLACDYIKRHNEYKTINKLDKWYWG